MDTWQSIVKRLFSRKPRDPTIIHGLFVDDTMHISSCDKLRAEFMKKYATDFEQEQA
jgi:hypothetical protein